MKWLLALFVVTLAGNAQATEKRYLQALNAHIALHAYECSLLIRHNMKPWEVAQAESCLLELMASLNEQQEAINKLELKKEGP